ncbi:MAG: hypothetical protein ASARMPRED_007274 [Alectoria sarmentosa]|nr:MAG: hypothetical protein ASARMPRED_007274 [Alectoria sarmentosa]
MLKPFVPSLLSHLLVVIIFTVLATALLSPDQSDQVQTPEAPSDASSDTIPANTSALSLNASSDLNAVRAQCSGPKFGTSLNGTSCRNAIDFIPAERGQRSFGLRAYAATYNVELPYRWLSRSNLLTYVFTTEDGLCSVQVFLIAPATVAHASTYQIWRGAEAVLHRCVTDPRFIGGVASNIGGDNKLAVVVQSSNNVNVQCTRGPAPPPPYEQCHLVAYNLPATLNRETFGSIGDPTVENPLPQEFTSLPSRECAVRVSIPPATTETASWYNIWEAVDAATQMCVRDHLVGKVSGIGK